MFVASKVRAKITDADPVFKTRYLGNTEVFVPNGTGCTNVPVQKLWDNSGEEKVMRKVSTVINIHGIFMRDCDKKKDEGKLFPIENISFCNAESIANGKIFSWISKDDNGPRLICHAVLCSTPEKAKSMAIVMSRAFQIAYKEWKTEQNSVQRNERKDNVKTKTADLKLKPKYQISQPGSKATQNGASKDKSSSNSEHKLIHGEEIKSKQNGTEDTASADDTKSIQSTSSGNVSVNSKYKDSECQTCDISNGEVNENGKENRTFTDGIHSEEKTIQHDSIQADCRDAITKEEKDSETGGTVSGSVQIEENDTEISQKL